MTHTQARQQGYLRAHTRTYSYARHGETTAGREAGAKERNCCCAAAEWEQKTNGGSYIRERQNERDGERREKGAAEGEIVGDGGTSEIEGVKE